MVAHHARAADIAAQRGLAEDEAELWGIRPIEDLRPLKTYPDLLVDLLVGGPGLAAGEHGPDVALGLEQAGDDLGRYQRSSEASVSRSTYCRNQSGTTLR